MRIAGAVLTPIQTPLYGFIGDYVRVVGMIDLHATIGDGVEKVTRMVDQLSTNLQFTTSH